MTAGGPTQPVGSGASPWRRLPRGGLRTLLFAFGQALVIWATTAILLWSTYRQDMQSWRAATLSASATTAAFARQSLTAADLVLRSMVDWVTQEDIRTEEEFIKVMSSPRYGAALRDRIVATPQISSAVIAARSGVIVNSNTDSSAAPKSIADREAFRAQMAADAPPLTLTGMARHPINGRWTFYMALRASSGDNAPLGVMVVGLDAEYFASLFRQVALGGEESVTLFRDDGVVLATSLRDEALLGRQFASAIPVLMVRQGHSGNVVRVEGPRWFDPGDSSPRLLAPRRVDSFPVLVSIGVSERVYLANWREDVLHCVVIASVLTLLTAFAAYRMVRLLSENESAVRLAGERRLLQALLDTPNALCALIDRSGRPIFANQRFREVLGGADLATALDNPSLRGADQVRRFAAADDPETLELDLCLEPTGEAPRYLRFALARQILPDHGRCAVLMGHDETRRHEVQRAIAQSSKLVTLGELTTGMAHELSQPLNVMRMAAQNALMEVSPSDGGTGKSGDPAAMSDGEFRKFATAKFNRIVSQVDRAADIVSRMRIFGRAPQGPPQVYDVNDACRSAMMLVGARLTSLAITHRQQLAEVPLPTSGYRNLLEQVLVNLLLNARDALKDWQGPKTIVVRSLRGPEGRLVIQVSDTGPGVPADIRDRIFEPFFTAKALGQGTGLGLATSFGVIKDAGGSLTLLAGDQGTTFQVELPPAE